MVAVVSCVMSCSCSGYKFSVETLVRDTLSGAFANIYNLMGTQLASLAVQQSTWADYALTKLAVPYTLQELHKGNALD